MKMKFKFPLTLNLIFICTIVFLPYLLFADGFIIIDRPPTIHTPPFPLEVKYHRVNVEIYNQTAITKIDQIFYNPSQLRLEGTYMFPVPKNAVIEKFSMFINGKEMEAELLDAKKAKKIYEDIVRRQLDPALLEYQQLALFKMRIFPIEPRSEKRIKITYTELLDKDDATVKYLYPLNTEKFSAKPLQNVSVNVTVNSDQFIKNIYCPTHEVEIIKKGKKQAVISYEEQNIKPDHDFELFFSTDPSELRISMIFYRNPGEDGYFMLNVTPDTDLENEKITEKDITFVLDVSGSMAGEKLDQAKKALLFCLNNLNPNDRFQIIRFSTEAAALFPSLEKVDRSSLTNAKQFVNNLKAIGGTNIKEALDLALIEQENQGRTHMVIFITDGKPTIGETSEQSLIAGLKAINIQHTRIFTFGIGYEINTHLLDKITELSRAYRTYITPKEDIEIKISNFYTKVQYPVLTDLEIEYGKEINVYKTQPKDLPDIFKNGSLIIFGRYKGEGEVEINLKGKLKNKLKNYNYSFKFPKEDLQNSYLPPLWAARYIGYLLDQIRLHGEDKELIDEITHLAREHGIITPYTSYLILEDEVNRVASRRLLDEYQTLGGFVDDLSGMVEQSKKEYDSIRLKSGKKSIRSSSEIQNLNKAKNVYQTRQGEGRLVFKNDKDQEINMVQSIKNVQGRAFYHSGKYWNDARLQSQKWKKTDRIKFAGNKYFELLKSNSSAYQFLALGKNVRFVLNETLYEVYE